MRDRALLLEQEAEGSSFTDYEEHLYRFAGARSAILGSSGLVSGPFAIYKHPHANGFVLIHLPFQAKIIELEMQHVCKHAAERFAALDLNWWDLHP